MDRDTLIEQHRHLVGITLKRMLPKVPDALDADDLESEGLIGLIRAADSFDPARGVKFQSFAVSKIRYAILEYLRREDWAPRSVRESQKRGEDTAVLRQVSLDAELSEEGETLSDRLQSSDPAPDELALQEHERRQLASVLGWLPARERHISRLRYQEGLTQKQVAAAVKLSESRVCQIEQVALARLRGWMRDRCPRHV